MGNREGSPSSAKVNMPWIIYGTAWKKDRTADLVEQAVLAGFRGIDTAGQPKHYDEAGVGEALQRLKARGIERESVYLQTKFTPLTGQDPNRLPYDPNASIDTQVRQSFEMSQKNLKTSFVDTLILHSPVVPYTEMMRAWEAMESICRQGGARQLGISNCYDPELLIQVYTDATVKPAVVQNRFYADTAYDTQIRRWCRANGVVYQSFWTLTANPHILNSPVFRALAQKYGKTGPQLLFRYLNQIGVVPLTGTCSIQHMQEDLAALDISFSEEEQDRIEELL